MLLMLIESLLTMGRGYAQGLSPGSPNSSLENPTEVDLSFKMSLPAILLLVRINPLFIITPAYANPGGAQTSWIT